MVKVLVPAEGFEYEGKAVHTENRRALLMVANREEVPH
jgi:hypothetical protein